jgi:hypothetical protein
MSGFTSGAYSSAVRAAGDHVILLIGEDETRAIIRHEVDFGDLVDQLLVKLVSESRLH